MTTSQSSACEGALLRIARSLPAERVAQLLDYTRYVQSQTIEGFGLIEENGVCELADFDSSFTSIVLLRSPTRQVHGD
ncbi:MAG: hypothetical protein HY318_08835 [Armatimonadetes bacterium]|nr:hypothetical protein [Armatimonadota bacterium]